MGRQVVNAGRDLLHKGVDFGAAATIEVGSKAKKLLNQSFGTEPFQPPAGSQSHKFGTYSHKGPKSPFLSSSN